MLGRRRLMKSGARPRRKVQAHRSRGARPRRLVALPARPHAAPEFGCFIRCRCLRRYRLPTNDVRDWEYSLGHRNNILRCARFAAIALFACLIGSSVRADEVDHTTSARKGETCAPCVLILFLYDLNKNWHVIRAATYKSLEACKVE